MNNKSQKLYLVNGQEINVTELRKLIVKVVGEDKISSEEICRRINAKYSEIKGAIASMVAYRFLNSYGAKSSTVYFIDNPCMLQNILHPMPNFEGKIKGVYRHTADKDKHNNFRMKDTESFNASAIYYFED